MRVLFLALLLAVCVNGGVFSGLKEKTKEFFGSDGAFAQKLKNAFGKIREKFDKLKDKIRKTLELTPEMMASLKERLAKLKPIKYEKVNEIGDSIEEINEKSGVVEALFQGDMVLTEEQAEEIAEDIEEEVSGERREKRQAFKDGRYPETIWKSGVDYFFDISATSTVRSVFKKAADLWQKDTCINFKENSGGLGIRVFLQSGCWSYVGKLKSKQQDLSLGKGCESVGIAAHELGHALGFYHTMSRHDRDQYVTVNTHNIKSDALNQFTKETPNTNENYGIPYDYGSLLHYSSNSFSIDPKTRETLVPMDTLHRETLGNRRSIAFYDLVLMNQHYGCLEKCGADKNSAKCENGGIPHPRDCSKCLCPGGYGGRLCNERPSGCGSTLKATDSFQSLKTTVGSNNMKMAEDFEVCNYWIESPPNTHVEVKIEGIFNTYPVAGCPYGGIEIKAQDNQRMTGYTFCAKEDFGLILSSNLNRVPVVTYSRDEEVAVNFAYRYVTGGGKGPSAPSEIKPVPAVETKPSPAVMPRPQPVVVTGPRTVVVTSSNMGTNPFGCRDSLGCSMLMKTSNVCKSPEYPEQMKKMMCAKTCGYC